MGSAVKELTTKQTIYIYQPCFIEYNISVCWHFSWTRQSRRRKSWRSIVVEWMRVASSFAKNSSPLCPM